MSIRLNVFLDFVPPVDARTRVAFSFLGGKVRAWELGLLLIPFLLIFVFP